MISVKPGTPFAPIAEPPWAGRDGRVDSGAGGESFYSTASGEMVRALDGVEPQIGEGEVVCLAEPSGHGERRGDDNPDNTIVAWQARPRGCRSLTEAA